MIIKILVAHHKQGQIIENDVYFPIQVGKELSSFDLGIQGDNIGDNISCLNPIYCEMTAAYWGWKNIQADYVGLCHYRRYFTFDFMPFKERLREKYRFYKKKLIDKMLDPGSHYSFQEQLIVWNPSKFKDMALAFSEQLKRILAERNYDLIVPRPYIESSQNVEQHFREIGKEHIQSLKDVVSESCPGFYPYLLKALGSHKLYAANMFVMKKDLYMDYCNMVFGVLDSQINKMVSIKWCHNPLAEGCYSRVSGYLAEILTSAYIMKIESNGGKVLYVNSSFLAT
jgi:hypothetical protein